MEKRGLFCCESVYQLFNAIVLKQKIFKDLKADILLSEITDFSAIIEPLKNTKLFENVVPVIIRPHQNSFWENTANEKKRIFRNPQLLIGDFPTQETYTDIFIPIDHIYWKLLYYHLLNRGIDTEIHFFEEGLRAYTMDVCETDKKEVFNDGYYGNKTFGKRIVDYYVYEPELFSAANTSYTVTNIPKLDKQDTELCNIIRTVFQVDYIPKERFIFFEESYIGDQKLANDFQLFEEIVDIVGKENIVVKRHPRNKVDRFTPKGYKVMDNWQCPWEAQLLLNDVHDKIFVTISSTASVTPFLIFNEAVHAVHLLNMFVGNSPLLADKGFKLCYDKLITMCNKEKITVHRPNSPEELMEILRYLEVYEKTKKEGRG